MALANELAIYNLALGYVGIENEVASTTESSAEAKLCTRFYETCRKTLIGSYDWPWAHKVASLANGTETDPAAQTGTDGVISSGSKNFGSLSADFTSAHVGRTVTFTGAGAGSADLVTSIESITSESVVVLVNAAGTTVGSNGSWSITAAPDLKIVPWKYKYDYPSDVLTPRFILPASTTPRTGEERIAFSVGNYQDSLVLFTDENQGTLPAPAANLAYTMDETTTTVWPIEFDVALALLLASNLAIPLAGEGSLRQTLMQQHQIALSEAVSKSMDMRDRGPEKNNPVELTETRFS